MTVGLSCPEVAKMVVLTNNILKFGAEVFYEQKSEMKKTLPKLESEKVMENVLSIFNGKSTSLEAFGSLKEMYKGFDDEYIGCNCDKIIMKLRDISEEIGALQQFEALKLGMVHISKDDIYNTDRDINGKYPFLSQNICRCYLFERIMYNENSAKKDYIGTFFRAELFIILFYCVLISNGSVSQLEKNDMVDILYKTMRLIDHNESILELLVE